MPFEIHAFLRDFFLKKVAFKIFIITLLSQSTISCTPQKLTQHNEIKLSTPILSYPSTLFQDSISLYFLNTPELSQIHYTTDGSDPTYISPIFRKKEAFTQSVYLKAYAMCYPFIPSEMVEVEFLQAEPVEDIQEITLQPSPSEKYPGGGKASLIDFEKGSLNFRENTWMGFDQPVIDVEFTFEKNRPVKEVILSSIQDHGSWIFLPEKIEVITPTDTVLSQWEIPTEAEAAKLRFLHIPLDDIEIRQLRIRITTLEKIPDWHPGAGHQPWLFVDEIIIK
jgi:hypothetical protein